MKRTGLVLSTATMLIAIAYSLPVSAYDWAKEAERINKNFDSLKGDYKVQKSGEVGKAGDVGKAGNMQQPGAIKAPQGWAAIKTDTKTPCQHRFIVNADTLFEFDKSTLNPNALDTLNLLIPEIHKLGQNHKIQVEGHTDAVGTDDYNQGLSEKRAQRVKNWLMENRIVAPNMVSSTGYGEKQPIAPNAKPDGSDDPKGRQRNRRVEIVVNTCDPVDGSTPQASAGITGGATSGSAASGSGGDKPATGAAITAESSGSATTATATSASSSNDGKTSADSGTNIASASNGSAAATTPGELTDEQKQELGRLSQLLPSADFGKELDKEFDRVRVTPLDDETLRFTVMTPKDWESRSVTVTKEQLAQDKDVQVPLAELAPKGAKAVVMEVRYMRLPESASVRDFVDVYAKKTGFNVVATQNGDFEGRKVVDSLLTLEDKSFGKILTRFTALRKGERVFFLACSCPEREYDNWKRVFGVAAVSFDPMMAVN